MDELFHRFKRRKRRTDQASKSDTPSSYEGSVSHNHNKNIASSRLREDVNTNSVNDAKQDANIDANDVTTQVKACTRDLWAEALQQLSNEDRETLSQCMGSRSNGQADSQLGIDDLISLAHQKREQCDAKRWKFEFRGKQIILRDITEKIVDWMDKFKVLGDLVATADPVYTGPVWSGISILLSFVTADSEQMATLLTSVEVITYLVSRCKVYELLYTEKGEQDKSFDNLVSILLEIYTEILQFLAHAHAIYSKNTAARAFMAIFGLSDIETFGTKCNELEQRAEIEASNCERMYSRRTNDEVKQYLLSLDQLLLILEKPIVRTDQRVSDLWRTSDEQRRIKVQQWVSQVPYEEIHDSERVKKTDDTGLWLLDSEKYGQWRSSSASTFLWLHGIPGAGKTILVTCVIDDILDTFNNHPQCDEAFAYFYCQRNTEDRRTAMSVLRSFVRQLSMNRFATAIQPAILKIYQEREVTAFAKGNLSIDECADILLQYVEIYPQTTFVLDALDECDLETQDRLIEIFENLVQTSSRIVKLFVSSRPNDNIKIRFEDGPNMGIQATDNQDDIAKFVTARLNKWDSVRRRKLSESVRGKIITTILEMNGGMFQWAALQLKQLEKLKSEKDILNRLGKLPLDLEKAYDEIYIQIQSSPEDAAVAERAFRWIMAAIGPISPKLLVSLVSQDLTTEETDGCDRYIEDVIDACANLVVIDSKLNQCRLSHLSVQEYLERHGFDQKSNHDFAAQLCLQLLLNDELEDEAFRNCIVACINTFDLVLESQSESIPYIIVTFESAPTYIDYIKDLEDEDSLSLARVFAYVVISWSDHVQKCEEFGSSSNVDALMKRFFGTFGHSSYAFNRWLDILPNSGIEWRDGAIDPGWEKEYYRPVDAASFLFACHLGLYRTLNSNWTADGVDLKLRNGRGETCLILAVQSGDVTLCTKLIDLGADVNDYVGPEYYSKQESHESDFVRGSGHFYAETGVTALSHAASQGDEVIMTLLLQNGAKVNHPPKSKYQTALQLVSANGTAPMVTRLLKEDVDINAQFENVGTALIAAVGFRNNIETARVLIEHGANVNLLCRQFGSALHAATTAGNIDIVRFLIEHGADVNLCDQPPAGLTKFRSNGLGTPLHLAVQRGFLEVARVLLENGAGPNITGGVYDLALHAAVFGINYGASGRKEMVELLLTYGADVRATSSIWGTTLCAASVNPDPAVTKLLLDHGADVEALVPRGHTPLQYIFVNLMERGYHRDNEKHLEVVKLLLDSGADPNNLGDDTRSPLELAVAHVQDNTRALRLLLEYSPINKPNKIYGTILHLALNSGNLNTVKFLREQGADMYAKGGEFWTTLIAASTSSQPQSDAKVRELLKLGASVNDSTSYIYGTALAAAASTGNKEVVRTLLDHGADANRPGGFYGTPLSAARYEPHIADMLRQAGAVHYNMAELESIVNDWAQELTTNPNGQPADVVRESIGTYDWGDGDIVKYPQYWLQRWAELYRGWKPQGNFTSLLLPI